MKTVWNWVQAVFTAIGGFLGWFLGGLDGFLYALIAFVAIDYVTGSDVCRCRQKSFRVKSGPRASLRKCLFLYL